MNDATKPVAAARQPTADTSNRFPSNIYRNIYLPKQIYEALPAAYMFFGALFIAGAVYIGIGEWPMIGYLAVGMSCILAGVAVNSIRHRDRST